MWVGCDEDDNKEEGQCVCVCVCVWRYVYIYQKNTPVWPLEAHVGALQICFCSMHAVCVLGFLFFVLFFCAYRTAEVSYSACAFRALCLAPVTPSAHAPPERMSDFKCCFMFVCERES